MAAEAAWRRPFNRPNLQDPSGACTPMVIKNQYIVSWKDGRITRERAESDEAFVRDFVRPNKEKIEVAEPDMRVTIPERETALASIQAITQADNWGQIKINAGAAWSHGAYGNGVVVAVIDTGIDRTHAQLAQQLATNPGEMGTDGQGHDKSSNGVDDDGNGFIDDWNGFNFIAHTGNATDDNGHGTPCLRHYRRSTQRYSGASLHARRRHRATSEDPAAEISRFDRLWRSVRRGRRDRLRRRSWR